MKRQIIASLLGALVLFIWQFLSWAALNVHGSEQQYTPAQDEILQFLSEQNLQEGHYFLPTVPPGSSAEEEQSLMESSAGKPWARVSYHSSLDIGMGMNMIRGFVIDFVSVFLLVWILLRFETLDIKNAVMASLAVGFISYFTIPYLNSIWFEIPTLGYLIDAIVSWSLVGALLGWYLKR